MSSPSVSAFPAPHGCNLEYDEPIQPGIPAQGATAPKLTLDMDDLRTNLPPPSELSPVRPKSSFLGQKRSGPSAKPKGLRHKGSNPTLIFRSAATGGVPRNPAVTPPRTPPPHLQWMGPSVPVGPPRLDIGKKHGVFAAPRSQQQGRRYATAPGSSTPALALPSQPPAVVITRASIEVEVEVEGETGSSTPSANLQSVDYQKLEQQDNTPSSSGWITPDEVPGSTPVFQSFLNAEATSKIPSDSTASACASEATLLHSTTSTAIPASSSASANCPLVSQLQGFPVPNIQPSYVRTSHGEPGPSGGRGAVAPQERTGSASADLCSGAIMSSDMQGAVAYSVNGPRPRHPHVRPAEVEMVDGAVTVDSNNVSSRYQVLTSTDLNNSPFSQPLSQEQGRDMSPAFSQVHYPPSSPDRHSPSLPSNPESLPSTSKDGDHETPALALQTVARDFDGGYSGGGDNGARMHGVCRPDAGESSEHSVYLAGSVSMTDARDQRENDKGRAFHTSGARSGNETTIFGYSGSHDSSRNVVDTHHVPNRFDSPVSELLVRDSDVHCGFGPEQGLNGIEKRPAHSPLSISTQSSAPGSLSISTAAPTKPDPVASVAREPFLSASSWPSTSKTSTMVEGSRHYEPPLVPPLANTNVVEDGRVGGDPVGVGMGDLQWIGATATTITPATNMEMEVRKVDDQPGVNKPTTQKARAFYSNAIAGPSTLPSTTASKAHTAPSTRNRSLPRTSIEGYNQPFEQRHQQYYQQKEQQQNQHERQQQQTPVHHPIQNQYEILQPPNHSHSHGRNATPFATPEKSSVSAVDPPSQSLSASGIMSEVARGTQIQGEGFHQGFGHTSNHPTQAPGEDVDLGLEARNRYHFDFSSNSTQHYHHNERVLESSISAEETSILSSAVGGGLGTGSAGGSATTSNGVRPLPRPPAPNLNSSTEPGGSSSTPSVSISGRTNAVAGPSSLAGTSKNTNGSSSSSNTGSTSKNPSISSAPSNISGSGSAGSSSMSSTLAYPSIHQPTPRAIVTSSVLPSTPVIASSSTASRVAGPSTSAQRASPHQRPQTSPGLSPTSSTHTILPKESAVHPHPRPLWTSKKVADSPIIRAPNSAGGALPGLASPSERGALPTPPSSAKSNTKVATHAIPPSPMSLPPARAPSRTAPSPPPRTPSRQAREHQKRQDQKKRRGRAGSVNKHGSDVEYIPPPPPPSGGRSNPHSRNGSISGSGTQGVKSMPMPLVLNSTILASSTTGASSQQIQIPCVPAKMVSAGRSPSVTRVGTGRSPSVPRTLPVGRRERSADSYLGSDKTAASTRAGNAVGYRVFKQGAEEVMERAGRTMGPRPAAPTASTTRLGRGRSSSVAELLNQGQPGGVERGSILDIKHQHSNSTSHPASNVRSAPTTPRLGLTGAFSIPPPSSRTVSPQSSNAPGGAKRRPSVTLNTSFAALSASPSASNSQQTSPITRMPVMRPLPVPGSNAGAAPPTSSTAAPINPGTIRAFRALPSPTSTPMVPLNLQMPTPISSATPTSARPLPPPRSRTADNLSGATTPTLPYGGPPTRPFGTPSSPSPRLPLSLSIPHVPASNVGGVASPRMLPTPLTTTKEKQRVLPDVDLLSNEPSLTRNTAPNRHPPLPAPVAKKATYPFTQATASEMSPTSANSTSDRSGNEGVHSHPMHLADWTSEDQLLNDDSSFHMQIEEEIVFRNREEVDLEDGASEVDIELEREVILRDPSWTASWNPGVSQYDSPTDKPISPIVVGNSTFNDKDEVFAGGPRHRHRQRYLSDDELRIGGGGIGGSFGQAGEGWRNAYGAEEGEGYQYEYGGVSAAVEHKPVDGAVYDMLSRSPSPIRYARPDSRGHLRSSTSTHDSYSRATSPGGSQASSRSLSPISVRSRSSLSSSRSSSPYSSYRGRRKGSMSSDDLDLVDGQGRRRVRRRKEQPRSYRHSYRTPGPASLEEFDLNPRRGRGGGVGAGQSHRGRGGSVSTTNSREQVLPDEEKEKRRAGKRSTIREVREAVSRAFDFDGEKEREGERRERRDEKEREKEKEKEKDRGGSVLFRKMKSRGGGVPPAASGSGDAFQSNSSSNPSSVLDISTPEIPPKESRGKDKSSSSKLGSRPGTAETQSGSSGKSGMSALNRAAGLWKSSSASLEKASQAIPVVSPAPGVPVEDSSSSGAPFMWVSRRKPGTGLQEGAAHEPVPSKAAPEVPFAALRREDTELIEDENREDYAARKKMKKRTASVPVIPFDGVRGPRPMEGNGHTGSPLPDSSLNYESDAALLSITSRRAKSPKNRRTRSILDGWEGEKAESDEEESMDVAQAIPKLRDLKNKSSKGSFRQLLETNR
ncbi:hypothetical protein CC1G_09551 [Coprinopsis cinerea okayama7|uniref:Uncharacterized protein n=1 Tax=Coprinopsis cinerea (strain Okayama-7 / 130 / ATCC MYA-4618 / FGSC 9003) TaxID=240176 RepID=A8P948_COPC7|nr:hypothetical protein CC1G_09551 [Coprinopsis cinerea okayama7\|eukprot:XP_001839696.2 hypothetical protein CC1G_09551 [Coprinopsis cinerea okayama7\